MIDWLVEPLRFDFMRQALIIGILVAVPAGALSCLLVLKGWSLMGDAVSHSVLPGIVLGYVLGIPMIIGAFITGMICAIATGYFTENSRLKEDTVMGVVFSGLFAFGVVLFSFIHTNLHLDQVLFGDMLGVSWRDVIETGIISMLVLVVFLIRRKDILVFAFDAQHALVVGINNKLMHYGLLTLLSLVIVASIKAVGIILVISVLIAPGAIAFLIVGRFESMIWWAMGITCASTVFGVLLSYHLDSAPAPTIVVVMTLVFIAVFLWAPKRGILRKKFSYPDTRNGNPASHS